MDFPIIPYSSVGHLRFGMSVEVVRAALPSRVAPFMKSLTSSHSADLFPELGVHVHYNERGECIAIELACPANPMLNGNGLLGRHFTEVKDLLSAWDPDAVVDSSGLTSHRTGIGVFAPAALKSDQATVEGVIAFVKGYYD